MMSSYYLQVLTFFSIYFDNVCVYLLNRDRIIWDNVVAIVCNTEKRINFVPWILCLRISKVYHTSRQRNVSRVILRDYKIPDMAVLLSTHAICLSVNRFGDSFK